MIQEVVGSYRVLKELGRGGMGVVYVAEHHLLGSRAVVKMLLPELSTDKDVVERFFNEAKAATRIQHPGIVKIFDFGFHVGKGSAYIVMEMLDGETLSSRIKRGVLSPAAAAVIARQVASALATAHTNGIVHRDLKPDNIFLVPDPDLPEGERAKVLDFGIAKLAASQAGRQTRTGDVFGTPLYMSPEQCKNAAGVDARTDIYALGCILYEMVVGRPPFSEGNVAQLITAQIFQAPTAPRVLRASIPSSLEATILRALAKLPEERQASMTELAKELESVVRHRDLTPIPQGLAATLPPDAPSLPVVTPGGATTLGRAAGQLVGEPAPSRKRHVVLGVGAFAMVGVGVIALKLSGSSEDPVVATRPESAPTPKHNEVSPPTPAPVTTPLKAATSEERSGTRIREILLGFLRWSATHPGAACPSAADLATFLGDAHAADDPWGNAVKLTCTDQPADQIVGLVAAGPDGRFDTDDDDASWTMGRDVTTLVRGARWTPTRVPPPATSVRIAPTRTTPANRAPTAGSGSASAPITSTTSPAVTSPPAVTTPSSGSADPAPEKTKPAGIPRTR